MHVTDAVRIASGTESAVPKAVDMVCRMDSSRRANWPCAPEIVQALLGPDRSPREWALC